MDALRAERCAGHSVTEVVTKKRSDHAKALSGGRCRSRLQDLFIASHVRCSHIIRVYQSKHHYLLLHLPTTHFDRSYV